MYIVHYLTSTCSWFQTGRERRAFRLCQCTPPPCIDWISFAQTWKINGAFILLASNQGDRWPIDLCFRLRRRLAPARSETLPITLCSVEGIHYPSGCGVWNTSARHGRGSPDIAPCPTDIRPRRRPFNPTASPRVTIVRERRTTPCTATQVLSG